jgi:TonB family protein
MKLKNRRKKMNDFLLYLIKSACWLTGFTLVYMIFLRNERFFLLKRAFLLSGIIVSLSFPLISIHYHVELSAPQNVSNLLTQQTMQVSPDPQYDNSGAFNYRLVLLFIYLAGIALISFRMVWQIVKLFKTIKRHKKDIKESAIVVRSSDYPGSFSFINYVFINPSVSEHDEAEIMNHELVHVKQKHWLDLMMVELLRLLQWANPFAWIYTGLIRLNNEYLADKEALQRSDNPTLYRAALINQLFESPVISLSNSFNHSLNSKRFEMMKKITASPYRKLKILLVLPVFAIVFYAFAVPDYRYTQPDGALDDSRITARSLNDNNTIFETADGIDPSVDQDKTIKEVKGTVNKEDGSPFSNAAILVTGTQERSNTDDSGKFSLSDVPTGSRIIISARGYLTQLLKPEAKLVVQLLKDPDYKAEGISESFSDYLIVLNGNVTDKPYSEISNLIQPDQILRISTVRGEDAVKKYGEKARNGTIEIITRDKAKEMGIPIPIRRSKPEDFPTFNGNSHENFTEWVLDNLKYPAEAAQKGIQGRVSVSLDIQADGTVSNVKATGELLLARAVEDLVNSSPKWEPAVNPEARQPFSTSINLKFQLPGIIAVDQVFVVVEQMPMYPGGDAAILEQIRNNTKYPQDALDQKIEGRVIVRFIVTSEGTVDGATVLKGVYPSLDAEAVRVISSLGSFKPGSQGGKPVDVWYMVPVSFTLPGK